MRPSATATIPSPIVRAGSLKKMRKNTNKRNSNKVMRRKILWMMVSVSRIQRKENNVPRDGVMSQDIVPFANLMVFFPDLPV